MKVWKTGAKYGEAYGYNPWDFFAYFYEYHRRPFMRIVRVAVVLIEIAASVGGVLLAFMLTKGQ